MRLILSGLLAFCCLPLFSTSVLAASLTELSLTGRYDGPNQIACTGASTCQASNTVIINPPYLGPTPMQATIDASASFDGPAPAFPAGSGAGYGLDGKPISAGAYVLTGSLNTTQSTSFGLYSQQQNPDVALSAAFHIPAESGNYQIHAIFYEGGDANQLPSDSLDITAAGVFYHLTNSYCTGGFGGQSCYGPPSADFTLLHDPGTLGEIEFYASSSAWNTGLDSANFQVVITPLDPSADATIPEPGTLPLFSLSLAALVLLKRRRRPAGMNPGSPKSVPRVR